MYMAAMAVSDFMVLSTQAVLSILHEIHSLNEYLVETSCRSLIFGFFFGLHYSVVLLIGMTTEKFISIQYPLKAAIWITRRRAGIAIGALASLILLLNWQHYIVWGVTEDRDVYRNRTGFNNISVDCMVTIEGDFGFYMEKVYGWIDASIYSFIPVISLILMNSLIMMKIFRSKNDLQNISTVPLNKKTAEKQITIMMLSTTTMFLILTMPLAAVVVLRSTLPTNSIPPLVWSIVILMEFLNHAVNVMMYMIFSQQFRTHTLNLLTCNRQRKPPKKLVSLETLSTGTYDTQGRSYTNGS